MAKILLLATMLLIPAEKPPQELWHVKLLDCSGSVIQEWDTDGFDEDTNVTNFIDSNTGHDIKVHGTLVIERLR